MKAYIRDKLYNVMLIHLAGQYLYSYKGTNPTKPALDCMIDKPSDRDELLAFPRS